MEHALAPLVLVPKETEAIWGGDALVRRYGKAGDPAATLGESWECWDENRVHGGPYGGASLADLRGRLGARLMGGLDAARLFPVLTKIIDARQALSVQVHPGDAYAQRIENQPFGKTECWYILEADPGAELVLGWTHGTTRAEYERRVKDGTLGDVLRRVPVKTGDAFYLPSGTLHAIGAGIQLFETQQASDLTYRIFDWNRLGTDGKPRQLHVDKAADVLDFRVSTTTAATQLAYAGVGFSSNALIADPRFAVEHMHVRAGASIALDGLPLIVMAMEEALVLRGGGGEIPLRAWSTALVPAELATVEIAPSRAPHAGALVVTPGRAVFERRLERAGVPASQRTAFLAQFEPQATAA